MSESPILREQTNHVVTLSFNRPEQRNAYTAEMSNLLTAHLRDCDEDPDVRVVIVTAVGESFCVGLDMNDIRDMGDAEAPKTKKLNQPTQRVLRTYPFQISKPVICAINGIAAGFGAAYPLTCDIRLIAEEAAIAFSFVKWGLVPEMGATWTLPRLVGVERASELMLTGRKVGAAEVVDMGLALRSVPRADLMTDAHQLARDIAEGASPTAVSVVKQMIWGRYMDEGELYRAIYEDDDAIAWAIRSPDAKEGTTAFFEKRAPQWQGADRDRLPGYGRRNANPFGIG